MTARSFKAKIEGWAKATQAQIEGIARQTCMEMSERVVRATPVDTGFLRGSWQPAVNEPKLKDSAPLDKEGEISIALAGIVANAVKPGDRFYMINNASYAMAQEYGTPKMSGRFYVQGAVKQWQAIVDQVASELGVKK